MRPTVLMDTGPLVAYFSARDAHHAWAVERFASFAPPVLTCEPVVAEACHLLGRVGVPGRHLVEKLRLGTIRVGFALEPDASFVGALMERYADVPMSLADACLVRMAETSGLVICTLDSDFRIYRRSRGRPLALIAPFV